MRLPGLTSQEDGADALAMEAVLSLAAAGEHPVAEAVIQLELRARLLQALAERCHHAIRFTCRERLELDE